jgi:glutamyl-tRNA synthetase
MTPVVCFAARPGGLLHVGDARLALTAWLFARARNGHFILRLDDADRERSKPNFAEAIEPDLRWLGITCDAYLRQSERRDRYMAAIERLKQAGRLYPCFESDEELRAKRQQRLKRGLAPLYDRAMLKLTAAQRAAAESSGKRPYWRFLLSGVTVAWNDLVLGHREVKLPVVSDPVLIRADGTPLRTLTSVVDDIETGITHTVRGEDRVTDTAVQMDIFAALGADPDQRRHAHLPLLQQAAADSSGKSLDSLTLRGLRHDGMEPAALAAYLVRPGKDAEVPASLDRLAAEFDFSRTPLSAARFDIRQLLALNRRMLHGLPFSAVVDRLPPGATEAFWLAVRGSLDLLSEARGWWDVVAGTIVPPVVEGEEQFLKLALDKLPSEPWDRTVWRAWTNALREATGRTGRALFRPLCVALTGEESGPDLHDLLPLMGRTRAAGRLHVAAA